jgi:hypothetical protein
MDENLKDYGKMGNNMIMVLLFFYNKNKKYGEWYEGNILKILMGICM